MYGHVWRLICMEESGPSLLNWPEQVSVAAQGQGLAADSEPLRPFGPTHA